MLTTRTLLLLTTVALALQTAPAPSAFAQEPLSFDVTSVRPTPKERLHLLKSEKCPNGGPFIAIATPLKWTIEYAYAGANVKVTGGPAWLDSFDDVYDIEGKPDHKVTDAECRLMVRSLLQDRFKLKVHPEVKEVPAYALTVGKHGPRLQPAKPVTNGGGVHVNGALQQKLSEREAPDGWSMSALAAFTSDFVHRPVVDHTNLSGSYSFSMHFAHTPDAPDPDIATALEEQLGLKLEPTRMNQDQIVIDHIETPIQN